MSNLTTNTYMKKDLLNYIPALFRSLIHKLALASSNQANPFRVSHNHIQALCNTNLPILARGIRSHQTNATSFVVIALLFKFDSHAFSISAIHFDIIKHITNTLKRYLSTPGFV